jgi:predicted amidohydrolase
MKIAAAQIKVHKQSTATNIADHCRLTELAAGQGVRLIVFPEMSLTGYELALASELAFTENDPRLEILKEKAALYDMIIIAGAPVKIGSKLYIGSFIFLPDNTVEIYTKQYLHVGEEVYFESSFDHNPVVRLGTERIAQAICADITNPSHPAAAGANRASLYVASIFYSPQGIDEAYQQLSGYAEKYAMSVLMANYVGKSDEYLSAGRSAFWNNMGELVVAADSEEESLLLVDLHANGNEHTIIYTEHQALQIHETKPGDTAY